MKQTILKKLKEENLIEENEFNTIQKHLKDSLFSLHWELKTLLYLGVMLFCTGAGLIIYQNIDSISHQAILLALALSCATAFYVCYQKFSPFNPELVESPGVQYDYLLLFACLLFLSFESYLEFKYEIFGSKYGLATLIPSLFFLYLAYRFDHKGILSLGITGIAGTMGFTVTPQDVIMGNSDIPDVNYIWIGIFFGVITSVSAFFMESKSIKKHFTFTYLNFAANALFIALLAGLILSERYQLFLFIFFSIVNCLFFYIYAKRTQSFYFLLITFIYGYISFTYLLFSALLYADNMNASIFYFGCFYFIGSCYALIKVLMNYKKLLAI